MGAKKKSSGDGGERETLSFEDAMDEVEGIVEELEGDDVPLEKLLEKYERGTALIQVCQERIAAAQARVVIIASRAGGEKSAEAFDPGQGESGEGEASGGGGEIKLL